jgi:6-phosphogluconolactonase (cycloisomerase 2 family)
MNRPLKLVVCLVAALCAEAALAQLPPPPIGGGLQPRTSGPPIASVYVSSSPGNNIYEINAFAADSKGELTPVPGSPFPTPTNVRSMAVNGKYLFGTDLVNIYSFSIANDGGLQQVASINAQLFNGGTYGGPFALFLDHTRTTLYDEDFDGDQGANTDYQSFNIEKPTGELSFLGVTSAASPSYSVPLSFIGNNKYAYSSTCYHFSPSIFGFKREADGKLTQLNINPPLPVASPKDFYCPYLAAADPTGNLAVSVQELTGNWGIVGAPRVAVYTADSSGNLTTQSTFANMPKTAIKNVTYLQVSPSGQLLAVAGRSGLQVFHFNGSNPITHYSGLICKDEVDQMFWDNNSHLYAISQSAGKLYVYTITPTSLRHAPGSPYSIANPANIIVLPKT